MRRVVKKFLVALGLSHKTDHEKIEKYEEVIVGLEADVYTFGIMDPTTGSTTTKINFVKNEIVEKNIMENNLRTKNVSISGHMDELGDIFQDKYIPVIQTKADPHVEKVTELGLKMKAEAGVNPDEIPEVENLSVTTGHVNRSLNSHWDTIDKKLVRGYNVMISVNPLAPAPIYTLYMFTKKSTCLIKDQILGGDVGIKIVSLGKKDGVQSEGCAAVIRKVVNPHN